MILPLRVRLVDGEPADSLQARLATRWHRSAAEFAADIRLPLTVLRKGGRLEELAALAGGDAAALAAATPTSSRGTRRVWIGTAWTDVLDVAPFPRRRCPECLREDRERAMADAAPAETAAWARRHWQIRAIATCVEHGRVMVSACPACSRPASAADPALDRCSCGALLASGPTVAFSSAVDAVLREMIDIGGATGVFGEAGLAQVSSHLTRLGSVALGWHPKRPVLEAMPELVAREAGLRLFRSGDADLHRTLDTVVAGAPRPRCGHLGLTSGLGWVWGSWLGVPTVNPLDVALALKVRAFAECRGLIKPEGSDAVPLAQVRATLGSGHDRARRLVSNAGLLSGPGLQGVSMSVDGTAVHRLADHLRGLIDKSAARALLGVGRVPFADLQSAGLVKPDVEALALGEGDLYDPGLLRVLIASVHGPLAMLTCAPSGCARLPEACRAEAVPLAAAVAAILAGDVGPIGVGAGAGLGAVWVLSRDLRGLAKRRDYGIRAASRDLGLHEEAARWLALRGYLGPGPGSVDMAHVASFGRAYCTAAAAGRSIGIDGRTAAGALASSGVEPSFGPPACRQRIWRRDLAEAALRALGARC